LFIIGPVFVAQSRKTRIATDILQRNPVWKHSAGVLQEFQYTAILNDFVVWGYSQNKGKDMS